MKTQSEQNSREKEIENLKDYKYGFSTDIENIKAPKGLNEDVIKFISNKKKEPKWLLDWRLKAYKRLKVLKEPNWQKPKYPKIDYQDLYYYSAPKSTKDKPKTLAEVDPKLIETYKKLGIPLDEQKRLSGVAVDAVFDSVSVATTFKGELTKKGIIFCSISEAVQKHPELVRKYLGSVIPLTDHYFATLNSAVFTDGSFEPEQPRPVVGGVAFAWWLEAPRAFSVEIPDHLVRAWIPRKNQIALVEIFAAVIAIVHMGPALVGKNVTLLICSHTATNEIGIILGCHRL